MNTNAIRLGALFGSMVVLAETTFYVATDGNDTWTGRQPAPNPARSDGPFASIERARAAIRASKAGAGLTEPVTVQVRQGTYTLARPLVFTAEDSGTADCPITYRAYGTEAVTLSGGRPIRGWVKHDGVTYVAALTEQGFEDVRFRELFRAGERLVLARYPDLDPEHPVTGGLLYVADTASQSKHSFHYQPGSAPFDTWNDFSQAEVNLFPYHCWDHNLIRVARVDHDMSLVTLRYGVAGSIFVGNRYFVQNALEALDAPGEWFSDYRTGKLYWRPAPGQVPVDDEVTAPVVENLIEVSGTAERPVEYLRIQGFRLDQARQDAITLEGARHCEIIGNRITHVGGVGVNVGYLRNALKGVGLPWRKPGLTRASAHSGDRSLVFSHWCQQCRVAGNDIDSIGGDGVVLGGSGNTADNNHLSRTGIYDRVCAGITVYGDENTVSNNLIHDVPRDGLFINGKLNVAEYNEVRYSMLYTADNAAIALRQHDVNQAVRNRGNVLRFNRLLDTIGYGSYPHCQHPGEGYASPFCSFGIYLDGSICGVTVYGNVIGRWGGTGIFIQFGGDNTVENNVFVDTSRKQVQFDSVVFFGTFMFTDRKGQYRDSEPPNRLRHNIFAYSGPDTALYRVGHWDNAAQWDRRQAEFDENLIWHQDLPVAVCMHKTLDCKSFAEWQAQGYDTRSVVADPLFLDAARDDYRLRPESPAFKIGFKDINAELARIGTYASPDRASWPIQGVELKREEPVVFQFPKEAAAIVDGFELSPVGSRPAKARISGEGGLQIADEVAATGRHSLRFADGPEFKNAWEPHVYYNPLYTSGTIHFSVAVLNRTEQPGDYYMEFRDWQKDLFVGPTFRATRDGQFCVNGRLGGGGEAIAAVPNGVWYTVAIDFELGDAAPRQYTLRLSVPGRPDVVKTVPIVDAAFRNVTWFGISSLAKDRTVFHVDNLVLGLADADKVRNAAEAVAIKGSGKPPTPPASLQPAADRTVGYWSFDEDGVEIADHSGNALNGDCGGALRARGEFGIALCLDGSGAATFCDSPLLQFGQDSFSLECWLQPLDLSVPSEHKRRRLIEKCAYPTTWWNVDLWSDGKVQMEMVDENSKSGTTISGGTVPTKCWTHLAITVDRQVRKTRYYLNGKLDAARDQAPEFSGNLNVPGPPLSTGTWQAYIGLLDGLRITRRVLTAEEISARYEQAKARYATSGFTVLAED